MIKLENIVGIIAPVLALAAITAFAVGLLAPLTPSYGLPTAFEIFAFWALPLFLLLSCATLSKNKILKSAYAVLFLVVVTSYSLILLFVM